jgi:hypothetical protein
VTTVINVQSVAQGGCVVVEVYDHAQGGPFLRDLGREWQTADSGRGMWLVDSVTRGAWRWEPWATGKVVVAALTKNQLGTARFPHHPRERSATFALHETEPSPMALALRASPAEPVCDQELPPSNPKTPQPQENQRWT